MKSPEKDVIYSQGFSPLPNHHRKITKPTSNMENRILSYYMKDKVYYSDNEVGEIVRNYLMWCGKKA